MKIVATGGGTGGHIYPALAVAEELRKQGHQVTWIGSRKSMESEVVPNADFDFRGIFVGKLRRYFDLKNFLDVFRIFWGFWQARTFLKQINPDVVFSKGGYVAVPVALAARTLKIPVVTHESDASPGLATKLIARYGRANVMAGFEGVKDYFPGKEVDVTGTPVGGHFFGATGVEMKQELGIPQDDWLIVVVGGSQGALGISKLVWQSLEVWLKKAWVVHQVGSKSMSEAEKVQFGLPQELRNKYIVKASFPNEKMSGLLAAADIVIQRSGASALAELAAVRGTGILIPLPTAQSRGDQLDNAEFLMKNGAAVLCPEEKTSARILTEEALKLLENDQMRQDLGKNIGRLAQPEAVKKIVEVILRNARRQQG